MYFDKAHNRPLDFGILLDNLRLNKGQFDPDLQDSIAKFLQLVQPFRLHANSKAHNMIEYMDTTSQLRAMKIPEMTQLLLKLIERVR